MDAEKLHSVIKARPFEPIRIYLSDGSHYDITHPDQMVVTRRWCHIGLGRNGDVPFEGSADIDNLHVARIEPVRRPRRDGRKGRANRPRR